MSYLPSNLRLLARLPTFIRTSRMNATTTATSDRPKQVPVPTRSNPNYFRAGYIILGLIGIIALLRASRKERKLIEHTVDHQHEPPVATKVK